MRQLVQLNENAEEFRKLNAELVFVFREEREGVDGLKKIKERTKTGYTLALDFDRKSTAAYSPAKMTFDNYVVDKSGIIKGIVPGKLRTRATAEQLLSVLREIEKN